jgi:hypothetical protein
MRQSALSFGSVLFDELEQVAVRRGGFASLLALDEDVKHVKRTVAESVEYATDPNRRIRSVREKSDEAAAAAEEIFGRIADTARAVNELGQVVRIRGETANRVLDKIGPGEEQQRAPVAFVSLVGLWRTVAALVQTLTGRPDDSTREARIRRRKQQAQMRRQVDKLVEDLKQVQSELDRQEGPEAPADRTGRPPGGPMRSARDAGDLFRRLCRLARGLKQFEDLTGPDQKDAIAARDLLAQADGGELKDRTPGEHLVRGAAIQRAESLKQALAAAAGQLKGIRSAYRTIAGARTGFAAQIRRMIDTQPDALRYELFDIIEDGARGASMRLESVGLAFSGGGIRSATFNLGFLQGMASLRLLKRFDYLSTVSGGGYIGAWFAAWVRREGGTAGDPEEPTWEEIDREARRLEEQKREELLAHPPTPSDETVNRWIAAESEQILVRVRTDLEEKYRAKLAALEVLPAENRPAPPRRPEDSDVTRVAGPLIAEATTVIRKSAKKRYLDEELQKIADTTRAEVETRLRANYKAELRAKRQRTCWALENVESQLNPSRMAQAKATRRWPSPSEISEGREMPPYPPPLVHIVDDEPAPVRLLRSYSNCLAFKIGVPTLQTWTTVSMYLRNLLVIQLILLPMMLAAHIVPRLLLLLFTAHLERSSLPIVRQWWEAHWGWPALGLLVVTAVAMLAAPKLVDFFVREGLRRFEDRYSKYAGPAIFTLLIVGVAILADLLAGVVLPAAIWMVDAGDPGTPPHLAEWLARHPWAVAMTVTAALVLAAALWYRFMGSSADGVAEERKLRLRAWTALTCAIVVIAAIVDRVVFWLFAILDSVPGWLPLLLLGILVAICLVPARWLDAIVTRWPVIEARRFRRNAAIIALMAFVLSTARWHTGETIVLSFTLMAALLGLQRTYRVVVLIREGYRPASLAQTDGKTRFNMPLATLWEQILVLFTLTAFGVSLLFARPDRPFFVCPVPLLDLAFKPESWGGSVFLSALSFGLVVAACRLLAFQLIEMRDKSREWTGFERADRAAAAFASGLIPAATLAGVMMAINRWLGTPGLENPGQLQVVMMCFGPLLVMLAIVAGSAIDVALVASYREEDTREWSASLDAYLLIIGVLWASFSTLSLFGPLLIRQVRNVAISAAGVGWVITSISGALAGRSTQTGGVKTSRSPLEYVVLVAPIVFIIGLFLSMAMLANALQGVPLAVPEGGAAADALLGGLAHADPWQTWTVFIISAWVATVGCVYININLFSLNELRANRLVRCYLGAARSREAPAEGRPTFAPTNSPVPVRRPNPITGFDPTDDFPIRDLAVVGRWGDDDLVVDYRGPYHLINTSMNLVAGSELAWQERMAESFVISPLYSGSKTTGYRPNRVTRVALDLAELETDEVIRPDDTVLPGFGGDVRLGTAVSVSGAAASPNAGYHSSPLVTILMTVFSTRLGLWFGNPARDAWRRSGPGFAIYLFSELFGSTTSKGKYVYLCDGGRFENLGVYELIRRRCRHIVLCDAGADANLSFRDLGSLVRKCREDFGVRIEIDIGPLLRKEGTVHSKWHCAVGRIHYEDVAPQAQPGTFLYVRPSLTGDEPPDVRDYVVDHPSFPHETTADQYFSESQFESYRVLGEHIAIHVFGDVVHEAGPNISSGSFFSRLRREWH